MCGVCMDTSVHKISVWCVESVWRLLYTSCQTDVYYLYGYICKPNCGVTIVTAVLQISNWYSESVWRYLYTRYQTYVWSLYGVIITPVVRLMCGVLYRDICTQAVRLMCGICIVTSVFQISDSFVESLWRYLYTRCQTVVWSLYEHICT
jgi:hypothetical protein